MSEQVLLPFHVPMVATLHYHAAAGIALENHPTAFNEILNKCTTIACTRKFLRGYTTPESSVARNGLHNFNSLELYRISYRFALSYSKEIIKQMIDEGMYVYFSRVDDYYLPGKSWYGVRHMAHDGIICGYNETESIYLIAAYDSNWVFRLIRIPQSCYMEAAQASLERHEYGGITGYRVKDVEVELDEPLILKYLKDHLKATIDTVSMESDSWTSGIAVHDLLAMYVDKLKDGSIPVDKMDWRALRPVWEHKRCMQERLKAIEKRNGWMPTYSERYAPLVDEANRARMMYAVFHRTKKPTLLDGIKNSLLNLREQENEILSGFVDKMEGKV